MRCCLYSIAILGYNFHLYYVAVVGQVGRRPDLPLAVVAMWPGVRHL